MTLEIESQTLSYEFIQFNIDFTLLDLQIQDILSPFAEDSITLL
jgi:hypothetical protein